MAKFAKQKSLANLVPDIKRGISKSTKAAAYDITINLKENGPYWTGQFEAAWEVQVGKDGIPAVQKDRAIINKQNAIELDGVEYSEPADFELTEPFIPEPDGLKGYMIGNLMTYRESAMDINPEPPRKGASFKTAEDDWFHKYAKGGRMINDLRAATYRVMKAEGFV